jgi:hypothetical protein
MVLDWTSFQKITEMFFSRESSDFTIEPTQIRFMIKEKQIVFTQQEYEIIASKLAGYSVCSTYISNSTELELLLEPVVNTFGMRYMTEPIILEGEFVSYKIFKPSYEMILAILSSIPQDDVRSYRLMTSLIYTMHRLELREDESFSLFDLFQYSIRRLYTIKVSVCDKTSLDKLQKYANSFLFNYTYNTGIAFKQIMDINDLIMNRGYLTTRRHLRPEEMEPPKLFYNFELTEQYNLGLSSNDPFICFIAFYHIMEHFFDDVYNNALINSVKEVLVHPGFSIKKSKEISKIINVVQNKTRINRETFEGTELEALELTIKAYVPLDQLHDELQDKYPNLINYYKTHEISFSKGDTFDLTDLANEKLFKKIAARIYKTRNSLVHSKSNATRVKERGIYHPFADEKELEKEIPLMKTIAEIIIIKSACEM